MAARTRSAVSGDTRSGVLMTRDTVMGATPAAVATSVILTGDRTARTGSDTFDIPEPNDRKTYRPSRLT